MLLQDFSKLIGKKSAKTSDLLDQVKMHRQGKLSLPSYGDQNDAEAAQQMNTNRVSLTANRL